MGHLGISVDSALKNKKAQHPSPLCWAPKQAPPAGPSLGQGARAGRSPLSKQPHTWSFSRRLWQRLCSPAGKRPGESGVLLCGAVCTSRFGTWRCCRHRRDLPTLGCRTLPKSLSPAGLQEALPTNQNLEILPGQEKNHRFPIALSHLRCCFSSGLMKTWSFQADASFIFLFNFVIYSSIYFSPLTFSLKPVSSHRASKHPGDGGRSRSPLVSASRPWWPQHWDRGSTVGDTTSPIRKGFPGTRLLLKDANTGASPRRRPPRDLRDARKKKVNEKPACEG